MSLVSDLLKTSQVVFESGDSVSLQICTLKKQKQSYHTMKPKLRKLSI